MKDIILTLRRRLRIAASPSSVPRSLPVLFFGEALDARVATIGLNPSKFEYVDRRGRLLTGSRQRFATTTSLGVATRGEISDEQADEALGIMRSYYTDGKPVYGSYFRHLANFVTGIGASYREGTAVHLDLIQEATDPVWADLDPSERTALLDRDLPFLRWQLETLPRLDVVVCAGKTVSAHVQACVPVEVCETGRMNRIKWWLGRVRLGDRHLPIGGWNYPLDRPTGLGTAGEIELGQMFARELL